MNDARSARTPGGRAIGLGRTIRITALLLALAGTLFVVTRRRGPAALPTITRPNLIVINTDDQRFDELARMPNVQSLLARQGITFTNYFVTTPSCCPSRSSLLTGQYSHHTGVYDGAPSGPHSGAPAFRDASTLATWLQADGYRTGLIGKYLNDYWALPRGYIPPGWSDWNAVAQRYHEDLYYGYSLNENGRVVKYGHAPSDYSTTVLAAKAVSFVRSSRQPFFLYYAPIAPHVPSTPAPADRHSFANLAPYRPPSFNQPNVSSEPWGPYVRRMKPQGIKEATKIRRHMFQSLLAVDRSVGEIVRALQSRGMLGRTYIFYTSDNGYLWGEHRIIGKIWPFEESIRDPLIVRVPGMSSPRTDGHLVLNIDLASTLTQLAGTRPGLPQDGRSLVPLLGGRSPPWRQAFVVEYLGKTIRLRHRYVGIRTNRYFFVRYSNGWNDLYDVRSDPFELRNLAGLPQYAALVRSLSKQMRAIFRAPPRAVGAGAASAA